MPLPDTAGSLIAVILLLLIRATIPIWVPWATAISDGGVSNSDNTGNLYGARHVPGEPGVNTARVKSAIYLSHRGSEKGSTVARAIPALQSSPAEPNDLDRETV